MSAPLRLAVVGCGAVTELCHLPALARGEPFVLSALVDRLPARTERVAEQYARLLAAGGRGSARPPVRATDITDVLDEIDVALVATGPDTHAVLAARLASAGKHVLLEKPVATTVAECARIRSAARAGEVVVVPAHMRRFFPSVPWVAERLASGELGRVRRVRWREGFEYGWPLVSPFAFEPGAGAGVLADLGPHVLDLIGHWLGGPMELRSCDDNACDGVDSEVRLELLAGGVPVEIELSRLRDLGDTLTIEGTRAVLSVGTRREAHYALHTSDGALIRQGPVPTTDPRLLTREGVFHRQFEEFDRALHGAVTKAATLADAESVVALLDRCREHRSHRLPRPWEPGPRRKIQTGSARRVAVTGATGFIGSHVVDRLLRDSDTEVVAIGREHRKRARLSHLDATRLRFVLADVRDTTALAEAFQGCDAVVHTAYGNGGDLAERWSVTVDGTASVLSAVTAARVDRLVHLSSMSVYDPTDVSLIDEDSPSVRSDPADLSYAQQKTAAERLILGRPRDRLDVVCLQPSVVYGPWSPTWTIRPLRNLAEDNACLPSGGGGICNAVHVHDVADAIAHLLDVPTLSERRFLLSGPALTTWGAFYDHYRDMLRLPRLDLPDSEGWPDRYREYYARKVEVDSSRLAAAGFRPAVRLDEGMAQVTAWAAWGNLT
ncbi:NAD-dependent epimerase/dehydratase family protein [Actinokineospora iranica]|uniref:Predicted dehydrogenase n=1 Tax=Actinokineospora iranica TaxID=1271860 RepID=A0A1G6W0H3_9PSEU|nr:NAD-dependent epimerase/dehydratase family protein [Actinokineospora iranica]SDD59203.1 Predicted dehydrogenase [Actinokineospora iranica]